MSQLIHSQIFSRLPPNLKLKALSDSNVEKINSLWPHRYDGSEKFLRYSIKFHLTRGLFDSSENLLAWCIRYDNGSIGVLQVDEGHQRKDYGCLIVQAMSKIIAEEFDSDVTALIVSHNIKSLKMFAKLGFKEAGDHTWYGMKQ